MMLYVSYRSDDRDDGRAVGGYRFRSLTATIDRLVIVLGVVALVVGLIALFGRALSGGSHGTEHARELRSWQLAALLAAFVGLGRVELRRSPLGSAGVEPARARFALAAFVAWWWTVIDALLVQAYLETGHVALSGDIVLGGIALGASDRGRTPDVHDRLPLPRCIVRPPREVTRGCGGWGGAWECNEGRRGCQERWWAAVP